MDLKYTGVFNFTNVNKHREYVGQGSIYRWLNPELITEDQMKIIHFFRNWEAFKLKQQKDYPPRAVMASTFDLSPRHTTQNFIETKIQKLIHFKDANQADLPLCTDRELGRGDPVFKYYKDPNKTSGRSTKNFKTELEALSRCAQDGNVGIVIPVPSKVSTCQWCPALPICEQAQGYLSDGSLNLN